MKRLRDLMTTPVLTLETFSPASEAWARMEALGVHHAVVVTGKTIEGVVSDADLGGRRGASLRMGRSVAELMQRDVFVASPGMSLLRAAQTVRLRRIGCIPVVERGTLVGIVTRTDLLRALASARRAAARKAAKTKAAPLHP